MTPDLRVIQNEPGDLDLALVSHHAQILTDFMLRSPRFTTMELVRSFEAAISEAETATRSINIAAVASEMSASARPATSQEIKRQLQVLIGSFPNASSRICRFSVWRCSRTSSPTSRLSPSS